MCSACGAHKGDAVPATPADMARAELEAAYPGSVDLSLDGDSAVTSPEGYRLRIDDRGRASLTAADGRGLLYGAHALLRLHTLGTDTAGTDLAENPAFDLRILNHWDNLDGTVERGYAGRSIWQWNLLPDSVSPQIAEYARRCAATGINATVLNNVNASPRVLSPEYLAKVRAVADVLRPYGMSVWLSVNFASPMALDSLSTADPLDPEVAAWWRAKADEIYSLIPDFGGFLVKANSEGQPGPCDFGRTHAEGANMLAAALAPHGGRVMWRAFVYSPSDADRAKQAYLEFEPLDGEFASNVIVQVKNGPIDFQPREPYSPLFGAMPSTQQAVEFQITQEYLGHSNHVAYLAPMWTEFFDCVSPGTLSAVAGVANVGDSRCLTGSPVADMNWYAFGRLAWNPQLSPAEIADEWLAANVLRTDVEVSDSVRASLRRMLLNSREAVVNYMMPLGLHHIFAWGHHYGPEPWCDIPGARPDWMPSYYHRADRRGLGFDRSSTGSNAVAQYPDSLCRVFGSLDSCPEEYLLWFHHVPWTHRMQSGRTLWDELCARYAAGVDSVDSFAATWQAAEPYVRPEMHKAVAANLRTQARDARWWCDACLQYFAGFSGMPLPQGVPEPGHDLDRLKRVHLPISNYECPGDSLLDLNR